MKQRNKAINGASRGHPALIAHSLEQITRNNITISQLLQTAATESSFYSDYLRRHLATLQQQPILAQASAKVIASQPIQLESNPYFKLESMGLIRLEGDYATLRCELYNQYFCDRLQLSPITHYYPVQAIIFYIHPCRN